MLNKLSLDSGKDQQNQASRFFELSLDLMCIVGFDGYLKRVNPMWTQLLGWTEAELLSQPVINIVHPDDHATLQSARETVRNKGSLGRIEFRYRHRDGTYRWIWWNAFPQFDQQIFFAIGRDITAQKRQDEFDRGQTAVLQKVATGHPLQQTLSALLRHVENYAPDVQCAVMLVEPESLQWNCVVGARITEEFRSVLNQLRLDSAAPCCSAAQRRSAVLVSDIATNSLSGELRQAAVQAGLHTCWSQPIVDANNKLMGTLDIYFASTGKPDASHEAAAAIAIDIATIAIGRHRDEAALKMSEKKFTTIFRNAPVMMAITNLNDGKYVDVNDFALKVAGLSREQVIDRTSAEVGWLKPNDRQSLIDELTKHGKIQGLEMKFYTHSGKTVNGLVSGAPIVLNDLPCLLTVSADITDNKHVEESLRQREIYLNKIINNLGDPMFVKDTSSNFVLVNDAFCSLLSLPRESIIGETLAELTPLHEREHFFRVDRHVLETGEDNVSEETLTIRGSATRNVSTRKTRYIDQSGNKYIIGVIHDITDRKQMEAELLDSRRYLTELIHSIDGIVWEADARTFHFKFVSSQAERLLGYPASRWIDEPNFWSEHLHPEDRDAAIKFCTSMTAELRDHEFEYRMIAADGHVVWLRDMVSVIVTDNEPVLLRGLMVDITEKKSLESQLRHAQKMEAIGTLAGGIAHDFNNILTAIRGFTQLSQDEARGQRTLLEYLDAVAKGANRGTELVKQITTFSRRNESKHVSMSVQSVVSEALALLRATIPASIEIRHTLKDDAANILGDATQIHQIVMNLCTNAWHAMQPKGGAIEVRVEDVMVDDVFVAAHRDLHAGKHVRLTVSDNGCGMDSATKARMYDPFFTTKGPGEGTGLGLAVVHGIVRAHDGCIVVASELNRGTTFEIYFPALVSQSAKSLTIPFQTAGAAHQHRVLLVDDEEPLVSLGKLTLQKCGYLVEGFASGADALAAFRAAPNDVDLVVTDLSMPGMSGLDLIEQIRRIRQDIPVIIMSGYIDELTRVRIMSSHIQKVMEKPFMFDDVSAAIREVLESTQREG